MAEKTAIQWSEATWNVITGCKVVSPGCTPNCYAMRLAGGRLKNHPSRVGLTMPSKAGPVWNGEVRFNEAWLDQPLRWKRPRMIFVCAHSDLFYEAVPDAWIDRVFAVMALAPHHVFQVLTKRPKRMREYLSDEKAYLRVLRAAEPLRAKRPALGSIPISDPRHQAFWPHVWLGTSVEDQARADERIPHLLATPAAVRWVSYEPALGPVDFARIETEWGIIDALNGRALTYDGRDWGSFSAQGGSVTRDQLQWIVIGGESAQNKAARSFDVFWAHTTLLQCREAGVPVFVKQLGGNVVWGGEQLGLADSHGGDPSEWPPELRVREFPSLKPAAPAPGTIISRPEGGS